MLQALKYFPSKQKWQARGCLARGQQVQEVKNVIGGEEFQSQERDPAHVSKKALQGFESSHRTLNSGSGSDLLTLGLL